MAIHPELAKDNFALARKIFSTYYSETDIDWAKARFKDDPDGRLSFAFFTDGPSKKNASTKKKFFAKISEPLGKRDNTAFGAEASMRCKEAGLPIPETYPSNNTGDIAPSISKEISPLFAGRTVLL